MTTRSITQLLQNPPAAQLASCAFSTKLVSTGGCNHLRYVTLKNLCYVTLTNVRYVTFPLALRGVSFSRHIQHNATLSHIGGYS